MPSRLTIHARCTEAAAEPVFAPLRPAGAVGQLYALWAYRELLRALTLKEVRVRYKQSLLGIAWAVLQPLSLMVLFTAVFSRFLHVKSEGAPYPVFSYVALVPWTFFSSSVSFGVPSVVTNMNLVTKVYFPREILPLAAIGASFIDFLIAGAIVAAMIAWYHMAVTSAILFVPALVVLQALAAAGAALAVSAVNVYFRDIRFVLPLLMQLWLYASPVAYSLDQVPARLRPYYMLNPMAGILDGYRRILLHGQAPDVRVLAVTALASLVLVVAGYLLFKRLEMSFADVI